MEVSVPSESLCPSGTRKKGRKNAGKDSKSDSFEFPVFSVRYRDPSIELSEDRLTAVGFKGWSTVMLTHGASSGSWYFEVTVLEPKVVSKFLGHSSFLDLRQDPSIRVGWSCRYNRLDVPVGSTSFGYSLSTKTCSIFSQGRSQKSPPEQREVMQISPGDVIGCSIRLSGVPFELEDPRDRPHLHPYLELGLLCNPDILPNAVNDPGKLKGHLAAADAPTLKKRLGAPSSTRTTITSHLRLPHRVLC
ncbi:hypothetical protein OJ253_3679 [Cryptosporidium canis]|uniref:B30.2/SPRY domain-containing protein n=1 Tax=Cryptosporidium canis TaxID=195482 RepID=A0A9D5HUJ8_9CRYT|nr:hypothetical protein OJ253_3679 [Cryptosporidium canis]